MHACIEFVHFEHATRVALQVPAMTLMSPSPVKPNKAFMSMLQTVDIPLDDASGNADMVRYWHSKFSVTCPFESHCSHRSIAVITLISIAFDSDICITTLETRAHTYIHTHTPFKDDSSNQSMSPTGKISRLDSGKASRTPAHLRKYDSEVDVLSPGWLSEKLKSAADGTGSLAMPSPLFSRYSGRWLYENT